jgi:hypothetical protein
VLGAAHVRSRIQWLRRVANASKSVCDFESCSDPVGVISTVSFPKIHALRSSSKHAAFKKMVMAQGLGDAGQALRNEKGNRCPGTPGLAGTPRLAQNHHMKLVSTGVSDR